MHPTVVVSFHSSIGEELPYEFNIHISTWIQKLCSSPLLEYLRNGSVFKGFHSYHSFHDDCGLFVKVIVAMSAPMLLKFFEFVQGRFIDFFEVECLARDICKHKAEKQVKKHKTGTQT